MTSHMHVKRDTINFLLIQLRDGESRGICYLNFVFIFRKTPDSEKEEKKQKAGIRSIIRLVSVCRVFKFDTTA